MYVLEHSRRWWHEKYKIECPDCKTKMYTDENTPPFIDIMEQSHTFWSRYGATNYDIQYIALFKCSRCSCVFKVWSYIVQDAGPPIGMKIDGKSKPWVGLNNELV